MAPDASRLVDPSLKGVPAIELALCLLAADVDVPRLFVLLVPELVLFSVDMCAFLSDAVHFADQACIEIGLRVVSLFARLGGEKLVNQFVGVPCCLIRCRSHSLSRTC